MPNDMQGAIALWIGSGTVGYFANLGILDKAKELV